MNVQTLNCVTLFQNFIAKQTPARFWGSDTPPFDISICFIVNEFPLVFDNFDGCAIMALIDVLVKILYGTNASDVLDVDVAFVLFEKIGVVGSNMTAVSCYSSAFVIFAVNGILMGKFWVALVQFGLVATSVFWLLIVR